MKTDRPATRPNARAALGLLALTLLLGACEQAGHAPAAAPVLRAQAVTYGPPITITRGGTYSGAWESTDPDVPAVRIETSEPVVIENSRVRAAGAGIWSRAERPAVGANLTVRHTVGEGLHPGAAGRQKGCFVDVGNFHSVTVEHSSAGGVGCGVFAVNWGAGIPAFGQGQELTVRLNRFHDVDGRRSDGRGGYSTALEGSFANAVGLNTLRGARVEIAWNEVVNGPYRSRTEDTVSTYQSLGTPEHPIDIHDNYLQGGYAPDPSARVDYSGVMINAGDPYDRGEVGYVHVHHNQVVSFENAGVAVSGGHHNEVDHNRIVSAQRAPDGTLLGGTWRAGLVLWDYYAPDTGRFWHDNLVHDNEVNVVNRDGGDGGNHLPALGAPGAAGSNVRAWNNVNTWGHLATGADEAAEYARWQDKLRANGLQVGAPNSTTPNSTAPAAGPAVGAQITAYEHADYAGRAQTFGVGRYNAADLGAVGNDGISSFRVPAGLRVQACEHDDAGGRCATLTADTPFVGDAFNDLISFLEVGEVSRTP